MPFGGSSELSTLKTEEIALASLERNMSAEVQRLQERKAAIVFDQTWMGQVYILLRRATGIYCLFRGATVSLLLLTIHFSAKHNFLV
jgi:hypothetical protein